MRAPEYLASMRDRRDGLIELDAPGTAFLVPVSRTSAKIGRLPDLFAPVPVIRPGSRVFVVRDL